MKNVSILIDFFLESGYVFHKEPVFFGKKQENRDAFFVFWQRYMAETNRDAEMQIGGRNGANMPFARKNRKKEPFVSICFIQSSVFGKDTLKTGALFAIDSAPSILKEKLEK